MSDTGSGRVPLAPGSREPSPSVSALAGFDPSRGERPWPLCGYAPGGYFCRCHHCGKQFEGDKRAVECLECASISSRFIMARGREVKASLIDLHDALRLWREYGGPTLPPAVENAMRRSFETLGDSDGSPQGGDAEGGSVHDSAGRDNGIAQTPSGDPS